MIQIGSQVTWISQSLGCEKEKTGKIIAVVSKGENAKQFIPSTAKKSHVKFDVAESKYDRVLVAVPAGKDGQITHYYCPLRSVLESQGN